MFGSKLCTLCAAPLGRTSAAQVFLNKCSSNRSLLFQNFSNKSRVLSTSTAPRLSKLPDHLPFHKTFKIKGILNNKISLTNKTLCRLYAEDSSQLKTKSGKKSLKEIAMQPAGDTASRMGMAAVAGGAALGIGALCFYGLGLSPKRGAIDKAIFWEEYVKKRIRTTFMYLGSSIALTAASAYACFHSPIMFRIATGSFLSKVLLFGGLFGSVMVTLSIPYEEGFGLKQVAWAVHTGIMGACLAPLSMIGGPLLMRAVWYTAGVVGGLSAVAVCAPSEKFLNMAGPLAIGLGVVLAASLSEFLIPKSTMLGSGLFSISIYGGLILFSLFLLYDTQRIISTAEHLPEHAVFDPVNAALKIYLDVINIFSRIIFILNETSRKK